LAETDSIPGGSRRNLAWVDERLDRGNHDELDVLLLADAQTSGGLVFGASPTAAHEALDRLEETGHTASVIGRVAEGNGRLRLA
jgi:selenide,water dikinase